MTERDQTDRMNRCPSESTIFTEFHCSWSPSALIDFPEKVKNKKHLNTYIKNVKSDLASNDDFKSHCLIGNRRPAV